MTETQGDFQTGSDYISFTFSPSPEPSSSRLPPPASTPNASGPSRISIPSSAALPEKPESAAQSSNSPRKGKRKASDAEVATGSATSAGGKKNKRDERKGAANGDGRGKDSANIPKGPRDQTNVPTGPRAQANVPTGPRNLKEERMAAERHAPWADLVDWEGCRDPAEMLNEEIIAFYKYVSPTRAEFEFRLYIIELITRAILKLWPDAEVTPFGSWQTQLYLPQGDIDLVVSNKNFSEANKARLLAEMARAVRQAHITDVVAIISKARVPIIKFVTSEGKLNVDISLNQTNGISAGKIINQYLDALPGARQLILVVKSFLSQRSMNEVYTGGLGSYAVICLVISFLQVHPKLRRSEMDPEENLGTLLIEFFELYGRNFNYQDVGLSVRKGGFYYLKSSRGWQRPNQSFLLSIEDPQDRDNDISGGSFGIRQVKNTLAGAYELLLMRLFERADEMSGRKSGRKQKDYDPDRMSILTGVMGITKETLKQRREIEKLHAEGRLQRLLGIPQGADPEPYVTNYRPPPAHLTSNGDKPLKRARNDLRSSEEPRSYSRRGGNGNGPGVGAIIVDDDEVPSEDDFESDFDDFDDFEARFEQAGKRVAASLSTTNRQPQKKPGPAVREAESGSEDGEIIEMFPNSPASASAAGKDRFASVSEDDDDLVDPRLNEMEKEAEEAAESRYALSSSKGKPKAKGKANVDMDELYSVSDSDSDSDSQSTSIKAGKPVSTRAGRGERRAFWAAKGGAGIGSACATDDLDDGTDFIGLE